jgi:cell division septation protein DedD
MTKNEPTDSNKPLKQRLLGAAVLVALAVIIIPELVKEPAPQTQVTTVDIPSKPALTLKLDPPEPQPLPPSSSSAVQNEQVSPQPMAIDNNILTPPATQSPTDLEVTAEEDTAPVAEPEASTSLAHTVVPMPATPGPQSATTPAVTTSTASAPPRANTATVSTSPRPTGYSATTASRTTPPNTVSSQQTRKVALPKIELISPRQYQHGPASSPQRPIASANVASQTVLAENSSNPNNWVVQAGSFAVAGNASLLRDQLRARNFPASLGTVNVDGRTLYRVNVGPYTSRTESEQARQRLLREASVSGSVRPM